MIKDEFAKIEAELEVTDMNNYYVRDPLIEKEIELFTKDIKATIEFVKNDCTASQFSWMSEVWDEIVEKTKSKEFVDCIKETAKKFPEECEKFNIAGSIESAEGYL
ncbi:MAG: hypothetical protein UHO11_09655 [Treponema sp.]|nr:hypothetical protein [Treponema sp.]